MSKEEIKSEINKVLDKLPDKTLEAILSLLRNIGNNTSLTLLDKSNLEKILSEDKDLLEKLAK